MIRIGAIMSDHLVSSLRESLEGLDVVVVALGSSFRRMDSRAASALQGIVCELSEAALDGHGDQASRFGSMPCAGLPVVSHAQTLASAAGIANVIRGPEDLSQWLASLAIPEGVSVPATAGHIIAVWGPAGSPGRSTLALCIAATLARRNQRVIVVDADSYAPSLAPMLGLHESQSGVQSLSRHARLETVDAHVLEACAVNLELGAQSFSVVTGLNSAAQYVDCGSLAWSRALTTLRAVGQTLVVDLAAPVLQLAGETIGGPMRNALTLSTLEVADRVVVIANPTPLSILRLSRDWSRLTELAEAASLDVCLNNAPANDRGSLDDSLHALWQFTGVEEATVFPRDRLWSDASSGLGALLCAPEGKNLLMMSVGRYVTSQMGIPPKSAPRSGWPVGSAGSGPKFSLVNWAGVKKRLL
jgi:MinD-like ATPase involved in chromosome partitioning or flagellar assembly